MDTTYQQNAAHGEHGTGITVPQVLRWSRMALRILSLICGAGCIGVAAFYNSEWTIGPLIMNGPPAILSIAWSLADIVFLSIRRGIHPAACIVVDTILVLALAALTGVLGFTLSKLSDSGYYFAFYPPGQQGAEYLRIILAFGVLGTLFHFFTLILVIYELKWRRRVAKQTSYVAGQYDESFGEAPPAYVGPSQSTRQQNLAYQPHDETAAPAQQLYELPAKKTKP